MHILHYASSLWLQCAQFSFLSFSQLNISAPELTFKYHGQWKEGSVFVFLLSQMYRSNRMERAFSFSLKINIKTKRFFGQGMSDRDIYIPAL